jgi:hypothetical protein
MNKKQRSAYMRELALDAWKKRTKKQKSEQGRKMYEGTRQFRVWAKKQKGAKKLSTG